jgi:ribosomal protein S12 methylthiotransferase accessory factor
MNRSSQQPGIRSLLQPVGGLFYKATYFRTECDELQIPIVTVQSGDISEIWPHLRNMNRATASQGMISGAGTGADDNHSLIPALVEGLERYSACTYTPDQFIWATAEELGDRALDLDKIPRCSELELAHSRCPLVLPDKKASLRWVQGLSLHDGRTVYIPAVMVYLYAGFATPAERIWVPISTGCAGHVSYEQAIVNGILETIERDALSIVWLQKLPLPRIDIDTVAPSLSFYWERYQRSSEELEISFFDATTGVGVPTVYGLQVAPSSSMKTIVSCCAAPDPPSAVAKVIRDMAACRATFRLNRPIPESWDDFNEVFHGSRFMADVERAGAFDFLLNSERRKALSTMHSLLGDDPKQILQGLLELLKKQHLDVYALDLSTDESVRSGIRVVRVLIPQLQPLGFHYRARYLGHARLYDAPRRMGYAVKQELQLNHWPQPFA